LARRITNNPQNEEIKPTIFLVVVVVVVLEKLFRSDNNDYSNYEN
jgi:hypothetical protein